MEKSAKRLLQKCTNRANKLQYTCNLHRQDNLDPDPDPDPKGRGKFLIHHTGVEWLKDYPFPVHAVGQRALQAAMADTAPQATSSAQKTTSQGHTKKYLNTGILYDVNVCGFENCWPSELEKL